MKEKQRKNIIIKIQARFPLSFLSVSYQRPTKYCAVALSLMEIISNYSTQNTPLHTRYVTYSCFFLEQKIICGRRDLCNIDNALVARDETFNGVYLV